MALNSLEELRTFTLVVELGSLSAAARLSQLSTNAVSRRVMRLEQGLGVKVLRRSTRAVSVTEEGHALYLRARRALAELDAAETEARGAGNALRGIIKIGMPGGACSAAVLTGLRMLLDANPALRVQLRVANSPANPVEGGFDVVLHVGHPADSALVARHLVTASWALAAAPAYFLERPMPKTPSDLVNHRCLRILAAKPQEEWTLMDRKGRAHTVAVGGNFESDDSRVLADAVYSGMGIGVRPKKELANAVSDGSLVAVLPQFDFGPVDLYALSAQGASRLPRIAKFLEALQVALKAMQ